MDAKLEINRLNKEELIYDLRIRGIEETSTVDSMRRSLRMLLTFQHSPTYVWPPHPYTFDEDSVRH